MRVFAVSDIHVDFEENLAWVRNILKSKSEYEEDILILAGDVSDDFSRLEEVFNIFSETFYKVFFVPGNHELWVHRCHSETSFKKFDLVLDLAKACGVTTEPFHRLGLSIVPLFSWYDFTFGEPNTDLRSAWMDFRACDWSEGYDEQSVNKYFLEKNLQSLQIENKFVISFSHFLPDINLMPSYIPKSLRYLYPVLGSTKLGLQLSQLKPDIHLYGHSHVNRDVVMDGVRYVNNAFAYPSESRISRKQLVCLYLE